MPLLQYNLLYHFVNEVPILCVEGVVNWGGRVEVTVRGRRRDEKEREKKEGSVSLGRRRQW